MEENQISSQIDNNNSPSDDALLVYRYRQISLLLSCEDKYRSRTSKQMTLFSSSDVVINVEWKSDDFTRNFSIWMIIRSIFHRRTTNERRNDSKRLARAKKLLTDEPFDPIYNFKFPVWKTIHLGAL